MADLKVTIKESINLNNTSYGGTVKTTYSNITDVFKRVFSAAADITVNLYSTDNSQTAGNVFDKDSVQYVRITNLEDTTSLNIRIVQASSAGTVWIQILAGDSFILGSHSSSIDALDGTLSLPSVSLGDIMQIDAAGNGDVAKLELFVASTVNAA